MPVKTNSKKIMENQQNTPPNPESTNSQEVDSTQNTNTTPTTEFHYSDPAHPERPDPSMTPPEEEVAHPDRPDPVMTPPSEHLQEEAAPVDIPDAVMQNPETQAAATNDTVEHTAPIEPPQPVSDETTERSQAEITETDTDVAVTVKEPILEPMENPSVPVEVQKVMPAAEVEHTQNTDVTGLGSAALLLVGLGAGAKHFAGKIRNKLSHKPQ